MALAPPIAPQLDLGVYRELITVVNNGHHGHGNFCAHRCLPFQINFGVIALRGQMWPNSCHHIDAFDRLHAPKAIDLVFLAF